MGHLSFAVTMEKEYVWTLNGVKCIVAPARTPLCRF